MSRLTVMLADLDRFKAINDRFGHAIGDGVLQIFADTLMRTLRATDLSGRLGGEEFAFLMPGRPSGRRCAPRRAHPAAVLRCGARRLTVETVASTVSIGVATTSAAAPRLADLMAAADRALYRAKADGRNRVTVIDCDVTGEAAPSIAPDAPAPPPACAVAQRRVAPYRLAAWSSDADRSNPAFTVVALASAHVAFAYHRRSGSRHRRVACRRRTRGHGARLPVLVVG